MYVEHAKRIARQWVLDQGVDLPGFVGAFHTGSTLWAPPDAVLPTGSDVDVMIVLDGPEPATKPGKFRYRDVLLEISFMPAASLSSPEAVLSDYHLAGAFRWPGVIVDPTGRLTHVHGIVSREFPLRRWVLARSAEATSRVRAFLGRMSEGDAFPDQVAAWAFGTGVMTHVLLVSGLRNPTVRRRYEAVRELLAAHHRLDYHETLLDLLGCAELTPDQVEQHLHRLEKAFDAASAVEAPGYQFASDLTAAARPISIDGTRDLIGRGLHREAVFWLLATYSRCLTKLSLATASGTAGASPDAAVFEPDLRALLRDLGAESYADRRARADRVEAALPELAQVADSLIPDPA